MDVTGACTVLCTVVCCWRSVHELSAQLDYERERRERLESQLDEYRREITYLNDEIDRAHANAQVRAHRNWTLVHSMQMHGFQWYIFRRSWARRTGARVERRRWRSDRLLRLEVAERATEPSCTARVHLPGALVSQAIDWKLFDTLNFYAEENL